MSLTSRISRRRRFIPASGRAAAGLAGVLAVSVIAGCGSNGSTPASAPRPSGGASVLAGASCKSGATNITF